jgi:hypothetical protein
MTYFYYCISILRSILFSQSEVEELKEQLAEVKRSPDCKHVQTQTIEE